MAITDSYDMESSLYYSSAQKEFNKVNDSLDVCSYRIIQNYAVNKVPMSKYTSGLALNGSSSFDLSDPDGNRYIFEQSTDDMAIVKMEDTLDVCSYRHSDRNNLSQILIDQESTLVFHDVTGEYSFDNSTVINHDFDATNESISKMEDTLDVCNYRRKLAKQSLTPIRYSPWMSSYFNKCHVPFALFSPSPIPMTSSPMVNNSSFVAQFSDQSDDTINLSGG